MVAKANDPVLMASAMKKAIEAGREAYLAGRIPRKRHASASSPLDGVNIFFPDPWHKKHNKRRIIQSDFIALVGKKIKPNGLLHIATDWENYANHILAVMKTSLIFKNTSSIEEISDRKDRPVTKFEKRGLNLDHKVWDLVLSPQETYFYNLRNRIFF